MSNKDYFYQYSLYDITDKTRNASDMIDQMFNRTISMFKWKNLDKQVDHRTLELFFQTAGFCLVTDKYDGENLYIYLGSLGGEKDYKYRPRTAIIVNPWQKFKAQLEIGWDKGDMDCECIIGLNDYMLKGLLPLNEKYATQVTETELSLQVNDILSRIPWLLAADDDDVKKSAENFLNNIYDGKLGVVDSSAFVQGLQDHVLQSTANNTITLLTEVHNYYKANWFNELGLNALMNATKKEAISESEKSTNQDILKPLVTTMLECRKDFCERVNERYNREWEVELDSAWLDNFFEEKFTLLSLLNGDGENVEDNSGDVDTTDDSVSDDITDESDVGEAEVSETSDESVEEDEEIKEEIEEIKEDIEEIKEEVETPDEKEEKEDE